MTIPGDTSASDLATFLAAAQRLRARLTQTLETIGLSPREYELLVELQEGVWRGAHDLDGLLLQQLASRGLIHRASHEMTRHGVARISEAGRKLLADATVRVDIARAASLGAFTTAQRTRFARLLARIL